MPNSRFALHSLAPPSFAICAPFLGFGKRRLSERGLFRKVHFLEILENLEILETSENAQTVENKGEADHFLEILQNLEILEIPPVKRPLSYSLPASQFTVCTSRLTRLRSSFPEDVGCATKPFQNYEHVFP